MRCSPKWFALVVVATAFVAGCTKEEKPSGPQIIYAGLGVSNYLEVGMTLAQIGKRNSDMEVKRQFGPDTWLWEKFFKKPRGFEIKLPSRGAASWQRDDRQAIASFAFRTAQLPPSSIRSGSNEIHFHPQTSIHRQQIIDTFGPPRRDVSGRVQEDDATSECSGEWESNSRTRGRLEWIYFPRRGIYFTLSNGLVTDFTIIKKFNSTNAPAKP